MRISLSISIQALAIQDTGHRLVVGASARLDAHSLRSFSMSGITLSTTQLSSISILLLRVQPGTHWPRHAVSATYSNTELPFGTKYREGRPCTQSIKIIKEMTQLLHFTTADLPLIGLRYACTLCIVPFYGVCNQLACSCGPCFPSVC